jgi:hypothetical protein
MDVVIVIIIIIIIIAVIAQSVQRRATDWTIGVLGFDFRRGLGNFLFTTASRTALEPTQPPILSFRLLSKGLKIKTYEAIIVPVVLYGCETWSLTLRETD